MKKVLLLASAATMAVGLAACSSNSADSNKKSTDTAQTSSTTNVKKEMVKFYMGFTNEINAKDADLNAYEAADKPDAAMKQKASDSAAAVASYLKNVQIPATLKDQKAALETAIKDLADSYQAKADELKKAAPSLDAANQTFAKGDDELGNVFVGVKLFKPSLAKEVD